MTRSSLVIKLGVF